MRPIAPLLLLPLLLVACALPVRDGMVLRAPQESPTAALQGIGSGKGAQNAPQASPEPSRAIPSPTEGPNVLATLQTGILWATQTERAYERAVAAQTATQQALVNNFAFASQTAQKPASTATKAAQDAEATQQIAYITQSAFIVYATQNAPAQELDAAEKRAQANTALFRAVAGPLSILVLLVFVTACLIYVIRNPRQVAAVEAEPQERSPFVERTVPAMGTSVRRETPPGWSLELMAAFAQTVRRADYLQGKPLTRDEWLGANGLLTRPQWIQLETYITETNPYAYAVNNTGSLGWTPAGEQWVALFDGEQVEPLPHQEENQDL